MFWIDASVSYTGDHLLMCIFVLPSCRAYYRCPLRRLFSEYQPQKMLFVIGITGVQNMAGLLSLLCFLLPLALRLLATVFLAWTLLYNWKTSFSSGSGLDPYRCLSWSVDP